MTSQPYIKLLPGDYAVHLDLIAKVRGLDSTEEFFADLPKRMKTRSTFTALLNAYVQNKLPTKAEFLMQVMASRGFLSSCLPFNHMLNLYISTGQLDKVPEVINELKKNCTPNQYTYNLLLTACADKDDSNGAEEVILEMKTYKISPDWVTFSILTGIYMKSGNLNKAREALEEMENRVSRKDRVAFPSLITLHASLSDKENVLRIWKNMKLMFRKMSDTEYKCILASLVKLDDIETAEIVYDEWDSVTGTRDSRISNILLAYYAKNDMSKAEEFHEQTAKSGINHSYTTWETLALGYLHVNRMDKALDCLRKAFSSAWKWEPNIELVRAVFQGLKKNGDADGGEQFLVMLRDAGYVTTEVYNMLLLTYVEARKMPLIVIERMKKDQVSLDEETHRLLRLTSRFCIGSASTLISS
ncbi:Pentatricopeptide repeat-containing protein [Apostasia shenzhenica]|uniref:Pentatricopeptide repeat-containing protein n=1 Tax=Apostasia shenzhenica TaxID=1088818 RepID=A0A2I0BDJ3_9ASPA|nr:Pentatricopeptide repeat-containing protein [Apostasia shenzhenica]